VEEKDFFKSEMGALKHRSQIILREIKKNNAMCPPKVKLLHLRLTTYQSAVITCILIYSLVDVEIQNMFISSFRSLTYRYYESSDSSRGIFHPAVDARKLISQSMSSCRNPQNVQVFELW
jgi:hypothetical protein